MRSHKPGFSYGNAQMYEVLKTVHVSTVVLTILGFMLRGCWMITGSPMLGLKTTRIAPHLVDTVLLASGVALILMLRLPVLAQNWLLMKFAALIAYIVLGVIALRKGRTMRARITAFVSSLAVFAYIVGVALTKSTASWVAYLHT